MKELKYENFFFVLWPPYVSIWVLSKSYHFEMRKEEHKHIKLKAYEIEN